MGFLSDTTFSVDSFSDNFQGGAKAFLFLWEPSMPTDVVPREEQEKRKYLVRSTTLPQSSVEEIIVEYQHLNYKFGGKRSFEDWNISLNVDINAKVRYEFEQWMQKIHEVRAVTNFADSEDAIAKHLYPGTSGTQDSYLTTQTFKMLRGDGSDLIVIKLYNAWPKTIGPVSLDYSTQDFANFEVTFSYMYHEFKELVILSPSPFDWRKYLEEGLEYFNKLIGKIST